MLIFLMRMFIFFKKKKEMFINQALSTIFAIRILLYTRQNKVKGTTPFKTMHFNVQQNTCAFPGTEVLEYFNR